MAEHSIAVYTTIFPNALPFLDDFRRSLAEQIDQDFDLWIGLDRLTVADLSPKFSFPRSVHWIPPEHGDTFSTIRQRAWNRIIRDYKAVVLVDSDDVLHPHRVASARAGVADFDVYACALDLMTGDGTPIDITFSAGEVHDWGRFLAERNVFGLSNTAYRCSALAKCLPLPSSTGLIDWHLISRAFDSGARLHFDKTPLMSYRLYEASTSKVLPPFTVADVRSATAYVLDHYENLVPCLGGNPKFLRRVLSRWHQVRAFQSLDGGRLSQYVEGLNRSGQAVYHWWETVAKPEWEELWSR